MDRRLRPRGGGATIWPIGVGDAILPGGAPFMINSRAADLAARLRSLRDEGCDVLDRTEGNA